MKKLEVWYLEPDETDIKHLKQSLGDAELSEKVNIKYFDRSLVELMNEEGTPEIIIIDTSTIQGIIPSSLGCWGTLYYNLRYFIEKHRSSKILIVSYVKCWAEDYFEQLKEDLGEEDYHIEIGDNGCLQIIEYLKKQLKEGNNENNVYNSK